MSLYTQMIKKDIQPDSYTYPFVLKACTKLSWIHGKVVKICLESDTFVRNTSIHHNAKCGDLKMERVLFEGSGNRDVVANSALTAGYAKRGELQDIPPSRCGYLECMISGYVLGKSYEKASEMFEETGIAGEQPDEVTMLTLLSACTDSSSLDIGERIHRFIMEMGSRNLSILLGDALVDMYAKCGYIGKAIEVIRGMRERFIELEFKKKTQPDEITFIVVLVACSHGGMTEKGRKYFELMRIQYGIEPNLRHYAGILEEAFEFAESMEIVPNPIVWRSLLGACRIHGNVELGKRANKRLLSLRHDQSGDYVLLSNIYTSEGQREGAQNKETGCTLIEADNKELMLFLFNSKSMATSRSHTLCYTSKGDIDTVHKCIPSSFLKFDCFCGDWIEQKCRYPGNLVCYLSGLKHLMIFI
ncbi:hypothetical protein MKW98_016299 [Papaver atlanticum]|uniref:Pentatricopeptide repeat-containing protein n=1 Tax=Papaver atlanticum TaxID=357466 RepID=A0AAD4SIQ0_9MAGN|nr:hypothetical protein MKW98_016299 [Papaver atlanticum]